MGKKRPDKSKATKPIEKDPDKLAVLLLAYAYRYAASTGWKIKDRAIARGKGIDDIVQDALFSLYGGEPERRVPPLRRMESRTRRTRTAASATASIRRSVASCGHGNVSKTDSVE